MKKQTVRKAVIPAAGFGTRFLPITKAVPKELLPIVDVPAIQINVEECVASGIRDLILITSRGKDALIDYFDRGAELEELLERKGRQEELAMIRRLTDLAHISAIRQAEARGGGRGGHSQVEVVQRWDQREADGRAAAKGPGLPPGPVPLRQVCACDG